MIHFKRFYYQGPFRNKIETYVEFPIQMNLEQYVPEWMRTVGCEYELYAISNHYGGLNGGHYTAFVRNIYRQTWYHFDDSRISPQNEQNVKVLTIDGFTLF
jgi:ubiquitin C-terminal hydrolase